MSTFTWIPDYAPQGEEVPRVLKSPFGDGYAQRVGDGINTNLPTWSLSFTNRSSAEYQAILAFLRAQGGTTKFVWTAPGESVAQNWICSAWKPVPWNGGANFGLTATFEAVP